MVFYREIDENTVEGKRTLERLLKLRNKLAEEIPKKTHSETLLVATWNIREFDSASYEERLDESIYYIAEIIDHFDLVAIQEVNENIYALEKRLLPILGSDWGYIFTDTTEGSRGHQERMAILWDKKKVKFGGLAGELVLPDVKISGVEQRVKQLARTPFIAGFKAGWTKFMISTVHILYGEDKKDTPERIEEIKQVAQFMKERTEDEDAWARNMILLGDFNIFSPKNKTFKQLTDAGFKVPKKLQSLPANANKDRHYDQIAFRTRKDSLTVVKDATGKESAGVFDFYDVVFRHPQDEPIYKPHMTYFHKKKDGTNRSAKSKKNYYKTYWRTHQMSDHLAMWVELKIDYSKEYLQYKLDKATDG